LTSKSAPSAFGFGCKPVEEEEEEEEGLYKVERPV